ncbi:response regulator [Caenimonas sp. SL110]|uniref:response regulator n=1 Tax=Caenimonas sp. SL110 TaxID=1450524 RepID=UPI0006532B72|nr:response regulator [Caenimonas sp. SL110]
MKRALIVDDNAQNLYLLRMLLQGNGFTVDEAGNGTRALDAALLHLPDVVISDLLMPEMDGYTLLRRWKADSRLSPIPFIVYTATYTEPQDEALALHLGADAFLLKPTEPQALMARVLEVLERTAQRGEPTRKQTLDDEESLRLYSQVLVHKLETRSAQLEQRVAALTESEAHVQRLNRHYALLSATSQAMVQTQSRDELFQAVCRLAVTLGGFRLAWIGMLDIASGEVVPVAWHGPGPQWFARTGKFSLKGPRRTPAEIAVGEDRVYISNDLLADPALASLHADMSESGLRAAAACPLRMGQHVVGVLTLFAQEPGYFNNSLRDLVAEMAGDVSFALENFEKEDVRRQAEDELRRLNAELEERVQARTAELVEANRALEAFNYSVSHDLRAPLTSVTGFGQVLLRNLGEKLDEASRAMLQRMLANTARMSRLIDDLLDLAQVSRQPMRSRECDLSELASQVVETLRHEQPERRVDVVIAPGVKALMDPGLARILLDNLIGNAWKFTSRTEAGRIEFGHETIAGQHCYFVSDNGSGFDMAYAGKLFTPFERLHGMEDFGGTGIGLSIVQRIVTRHKGRVWAQAAPGLGATIRFTVG